MSTPPSEVSHEFTGSADDPPSLAVVRAVAAAADEDPLDLAPLHRKIDTDALDRLCSDDGQRADDRPVTVSFEFHDCAVVVASDGTVDVDVEAEERRTDGRRGPYR